MRNPDRIYKFCNELANLWHDNVPDWRFGQFVCNVFGEIAQEIDPFFPEDDKMMELLQGYFSNENSEDD